MTHTQISKHLAAFEKLKILLGKWGRHHNLLNQILAHTITVGIFQHYLACRLLSAYAKLNKLVEGRKIFEQMRNPDVGSWTSLQNLYLNSKQPMKALMVFYELMLSDSAKPDSHSLVAALSSCARLKDLRNGRAIHGIVYKYLKEPRPNVHNALIDMYVKNGRVHIAEQTKKQKQLVTIEDRTAKISHKPHLPGSSSYNPSASCGLKSSYKKRDHIVTIHTSIVLAREDYLIMKTSQLFLSFFLFTIFTNSLLSAAAEEPAPVLDTDRNLVRAGVDYYILPVIRGRGGGLTLGSTGNETCPLDVVQEQLEVKNGLPLTFRPVNSKKGVVRVWTDQNIKFSAATICVQSTVWKLDNYDVSTGKYFITTGGVEGKPGRETISNWFKIEKYGDEYKLVFCPTVCDYCKVICKDVGIYVEDGKRRLGLTEDAPFRVMFKKASS
ncbi:Kunitz trypsin inhibitor 5 [Sesamum alatum]|uniref:Kunitz trypsin inhibitor 5 n=1 Tax=Sesamum alatum TaxID=300844 RepID=A0AAE2CN26_9LAMI|nr:Kunitz trypsin inhibitor 5 [Sesamum alatum]